MDHKFVTSLSEEADGKDFRVIAEAGGYSEAVTFIVEQLRHSPYAELDVHAQRDYEKIYLKVYITRDTVSPHGNEFRFDGAIGELMDPDGRPTGNLYVVNLSIDPRSAQSGQTVGVLRMRRINSLPTAI
jgi:hypothetical protein